MMTLVTASIASGSRETIRRTPMLATTMAGEDSQTIRKIGRVLRSAARRSFQRGTGLVVDNSTVRCSFAAPRYTLSTPQRIGVLSVSLALLQIPGRRPDGTASHDPAGRQPNHPPATTSICASEVPSDVKC